MRGFRFRSSLISDPREKLFFEKFFLGASPLVSSAFGRRHVGRRPTRHPPKAPRRTREKTSGTQGIRTLFKLERERKFNRSLFTSSIKHEITGIFPS